MNLMNQARGAAIFATSFSSASLAIAPPRSPFLGVAHSEAVLHARTRHRSTWGRFWDRAVRCRQLPSIAGAIVFARKARVLLVRHEPSNIDVDVAFGTLPFEEEAIARAAWVAVGGIRIPLPATYPPIRHGGPSVAIRGQKTRPC